MVKIPKDSKSGSEYSCINIAEPNLCKGYEKFCQKYDTDFKVCKEILPEVLRGTDEDVLTEEIKYYYWQLDKYFSKLERTYRDGVIGLLQRTLQRKTSKKSTNYDTQLFIENPFTPNFIINACTYSWNKLHKDKENLDIAEKPTKILIKEITKKLPRKLSEYSLIHYSDIVNFGTTIFSMDRQEQLNRIVRHYYDEQRIEKDDADLLLEVFGNETRVNNFMRFLKRASKFRETKPEQSRRS